MRQKVALSMACKLQLWNEWPSVQASLALPTNLCTYEHTFIHKYIYTYIYIKCHPPAAVVFWTLLFSHNARNFHTTPVPIEDSLVKNFQIWNLKIYIYNVYAANAENITLCSACFGYLSHLINKTLLWERICAAHSIAEEKNWSQLL